MSHCHEFRPDSPRLEINRGRVNRGESSGPHKGHDVTFIRLYLRLFYGDTTSNANDLCTICKQILHAYTKMMLRSATMSYDLVQFYYARIKNTLRHVTDDY